MRTIVKAGTPREDYRLVGMWDDDQPCEWETIDQLQNFRLHIIDHERQKHITTLQGIFAARLFWLFDERRERMRADTFNCFMAMDAVCNGNSLKDIIRYSPAKGEAYRKDDPLPDLPVPFGFQLYGEYEILNKDKQWEKREGIIDEGLILSNNADEEPIIFQKPGPIGPYICTWRSGLELYKHTQHVRFFECMKDADTPGNTHQLNSFP